MTQQRIHTLLVDPGIPEDIIRKIHNLVRQAQNKAIKQFHPGFPDESLLNEDVSQKIAPIRLFFNEIIFSDTFVNNYSAAIEYLDPLCPTIVIASAGKINVGALQEFLDSPGVQFLSSARAMNGHVRCLLYSERYHAARSNEQIDIITHEAGALFMEYPLLESGSPQRLVQRLSILYLQALETLVSRD